MIMKKLNVNPVQEHQINVFSFRDFSHNFKKKEAIEEKRDNQESVSKCHILHALNCNLGFNFLEEKVDLNIFTHSFIGSYSSLCSYEKHFVAA